MNGSRLAIGFGVLCIVVGWGAGIWGVTSFLRKDSFGLLGSPAAPPVVRTPFAAIRPLPKDGEALLRHGSRLTPAKARELRGRVGRDPGDAAARAMLMAYAFFYREGEGNLRLHDEQAVWFVANLPDSPVLDNPEAGVDDISDGNTFALLRRLYDEALARRPQSLAIVKNYAGLLDVPDTAGAIRLLRGAVAFHPKDGDLYGRLAHAYSLESRGLHDARDPQQAGLALDAYLKARELGERIGAFYVVESAFDAGRDDVAEREAGAALKAHDDPDDVHRAHTVLGRLALRRGDVAGAKRHLLDSAKVSGSPVLGSFGPETGLAKELLEKGERGAVLAYLKATGKFWEDERQVRWTAAVADGGTPDWD